MEAFPPPRDPVDIAFCLIVIGLLVWFALAPRWWCRKILGLIEFLARFTWMLVVRTALFVFVLYFRLFLLIFLALGVPGALKFLRVLFGFEEMTRPLWP